LLELQTAPDPSFEPVRLPGGGGRTITRDTIELWFYQLGAFVLLNVVDDPAWLAMMFC
jgi:hypothetical protein